MLSEGRKFNKGEAKNNRLSFMVDDKQTPTAPLQIAAGSWSCSSAGSPTARRAASPAHWHCCGRAEAISLTLALETCMEKKSSRHKPEQIALQQLHTNEQAVHWRHMKA